MKPMIQHPSAWLPIAMSVAAMLLVLGFVATYGIVRETDEGTAAHLWQLLMAGQAPIILFFALKWVPRAPKQALPILAIQIATAFLACAPVFIFRL